MASMPSGSHDNSPREPQAQPTILDQLEKGMAGIGGLAVAIATFQTQLGQSIATMVGLPPWAFAVLAGLLGLLVLWPILNRRRRRSRLLDPDALIIQPEEHLVGRDDDIQNLAALCHNEPLIWLVGESGIGKSSLRRAGLLPKLRTSRRELPIFIDNWGSDWIKGPLEALFGALNAELDPATRQQLGLDSPPTIEQIASVFSRLREIRGLPILIFDQFDDYQIRHRVNFVPESQQTLLSMDELVSTNPFWRQIKDMREQGTIHCIFTVDSLSGYGLECVRFRDPRIYPLGRLASGYAGALLDRLTAGDVVANPENGFDRLKSRLCHDLESGGDVLPVRMKIVFRSLSALRDDLTIRGYLKADGLAGLEVLYIQRVVAETSRLAGLEESDVRTLLLALTDGATNKTIPLTDDELLKQLPPSGRNQNRMDLALNGLEGKEIIRKRLDPDKRSTVWQLDHDYLCRSVLELQRSCGYWQNVLEEAWNAFLGTDGVFDKCRILMRPLLQIQVAYARVRGRLHYGKARAFALLSTARLLLNGWMIVVALIAVGFLSHHDSQQQSEIDWFLAKSLQPGSAADRTSALLGLSRADYVIRRKVLAKALSAENAKQFTASNLGDANHRILTYAV
ncbi:MAG: hypothetical protein JO071_15275, partial [Deltaproteobacteria bacterium]|nr:hypothetical protein [Deltaproteobacteria bacterium]